ncbi:pyrophosphatase PpaX [Tannockella kyphosi]|uniref:pyrophosphatase PpaX n=1 Tax=Tannockella kyphosi TaxID=2899121 RepID=UPI002010C9A8|nr:pyrophosphatase PpaX [Tannockella kyphosi]
MSKKYGVLFDLDGTVLYTDELILETFQFVFKKYKPGYELSREELLSFLGPSLKASFERYFDPSMTEELIDYYREFNHANHEKYVYVYETVRETLASLQAKGYPMAIVTTKYSVAAMIGLDTFDLTQYFDVVVGLDHVTLTKPNPEGVLKAMELLGVDRAVMIGDNDVDVLAAKNASIHSIAIKWSPKGYAHLEALNPDLLVDKMEEIIPFIEKVSE